MRKRGPDRPAYVVGIGGSAGGIEAFEQFFSHMPVDTGMAFVVVQHMDPVHKAMLSELLQRITQMKVTSIEPGMRVEPNCVYVIPPNRDVAIIGGVLQLKEPSAPRGLWLPIDFFLRSLAEDQEEKAVAVILSGMGTDGTLGLKAIKEKLGMTMAQSIESAKFGGMPRSAIESGLVDYVDAADRLPAKLVDYAAHQFGTPRRVEAFTEKTTSAVQTIMGLVRVRTGHDFSLYKRETLMRRIKRRMDVHLIDKITDYVKYLRDNPQEIDLLFKEMLIGVTNFFRNPEAYDALKQHLCESMKKDGGPGGTIRAWIVGCSTGEEAYSVAIVLKECAEAMSPPGGVDIQVFATDIYKDAIEVARRGVYDSNIAADVSPERLERFFVKEDEKYRLRKDIREMIIFAPHSVIADPPFTQMDLVCCRNLLIYFSGDLQKKVLPVFHYSLKPGGILFLGTSETISGFNDLFSSLDNKWRVFQRKELPFKHHAMLEFPPTRAYPACGPARAEEPELSVSDLAERILMQDYTPPAVLVNEGGDVLFVNGRTGKYLEPAPGKAAMNIHTMAREGLRYDLAGAVRKALVERNDVSVKGLHVKTNGDEQIIDLTVKPINKPESMQNLAIVVFEDVAPVRRARRSRTEAGDAPLRVAGLEHELAYTKERLQTTIEEMEASREELQATNEELQSTNEELQSTNEELTTSKEELQSLNEELVTVNAELQAKVDELSHSNNDMRNLLNSTQIATIFLDRELRIRRFTPQATKMIKMIEGDIGRPITDLVVNIGYDRLADDAATVLRTLSPTDVEVRTKDGQWYLMRTMPYRTVDDVIDGVVMTFTDIAALKRLEDATNLSRYVMDTVREPMLILDSEFKVVQGNRSFFETFRVSPEETIGKEFFELGDRQWDMPALRDLLESILPQETEFEGYIVEHDFPSIGPKKMILNARRMRMAEGESQLILLAMDDITEKP